MIDHAHDRELEVMAATAERTIRVAIAINEAETLHDLRGFLGEDDRFEVISICRQRQRLLECVRRERPDLIFLDLDDPDQGGFEVLEDIPVRDSMCVLLSQRSSQAERAFEYGVTDFVTTPLLGTRVYRTLDRVLERQAAAATPLSSHATTETTERGAGSRAVDDAEPFILRCTNSVLLLKPRDLVFGESAGNYVRIEIEGREFLTRESMSDLMERLGACELMRVHRSYFVNRREIIAICPASSGGGNALLMRGGFEVPIGRTFRDQVMASLGLD